jgi:hypothetical protein
MPFCVSSLPPGEFPLVSQMPRKHRIRSERETFLAQVAGPWALFRSKDMLSLCRLSQFGDELLFFEPQIPIGIRITRDVRCKFLQRISRAPEKSR